MSVDLRSDTVTRPTPAMRRAMAEAAVGDEVYGGDPTVNALEARAAELLGTEAAVFVASGTMANQIAISIWTRPGDEVLVHEDAHPAHHEAGGAAANSGVSLVPLPGPRGRIAPEAVAAAVRPDAVYHAHTALLMVENTHNLCGGAVISASHLSDLTGVARAHGLAVHLDGARLFNAAAASGTSARDFAATADTISFCLSKGLGAPVGSMLCGSGEAIARARRVKSRLGGAWRQAGIIAAAGLHALAHHVERLTEDHRRARALAEAASATGAWAPPHEVETNIVYLDRTQDGVPAGPDLAAALADRGVLVNPTGPEQIRLVTHLDVGDAGVEQAVEAFEKIAA